MRTKLKGLIREEAGAALVLTLVLLLIGGLIIAPLLGHMGTGHTAGQVHEKRMDEFYAADAGVEEAIWYVRQGITPSVGDEASLTELIGQNLLSDGANYKTVEVMLFTKSKGVAGGTYRITSNATTLEQASTIIEAWLDYMPAFWNNAITTPDEIYLKSNTLVDGNTAGNLTGPSGEPKGEVTGQKNEPWDPDAWPFNVDFRDFYVNVDPPLPVINTVCGTSLDVAGPQALGPAMFADDFDVSICSTEKNIIAQLNGTLYISGADSTMTIGDNPSKPFILDLNHKTIFVEGDSRGSGKQALIIRENVEIVGSGVIIAVGDILYKPNMTIGSEDDFIFLLSLGGSIEAQPSGTFYGSMAARYDVEIFGGTGARIEQTQPPIDMLNFPTDPQGYHKVFIRTWTIDLTSQ